MFEKAKIWFREKGSPGDLIGGGAFVISVAALCLFAKQNSLILKTFQTSEETLALMRISEGPFLKRTSVGIERGLGGKEIPGYYVFWHNVGRTPAHDVRATACFQVGGTNAITFRQKPHVEDCVRNESYGPFVIGPGEKQGVTFRLPKIKSGDTVYFAVRVIYKGYTDTTKNGVEAYGFFDVKTEGFIVTYEAPFYPVK